MPARILVVEDDRLILDLMELLLQRAGYEPVLIQNGIEALESVKTSPPALILLDIMMAPINGWDFLEVIRADETTRKIPVIIFSASPTIDDKIRTLNDPHLGMLAKPVTFAELKAGIGQFLH